MSALIPPAIRAAKGGGVFFLHGQDQYRKSLAASFLVERYSDAATRDFNLDRLHGTELTVESLASVVATPPMMSEWRVVHVREVEALASSPKAREVVLRTARKPSAGLVLILQGTVPARSRAKFYTDLRREATSVEFKPIPADGVPAWLTSWARDDLGVALELEGAQQLAGAVGTDLGVLTQEVRKLAAMVGDDPIDADAVRRGGIRIPRQDRWAWFDLVGGRRIREAVEGLPVLLQQGETAIGLVIALSLHLLRLGVAVEGGAQALREVLPPWQRFAARRLVAQARRWNRDELASAVRGLRRLDQLLKASAIDDEVLVEEWLHGLVVRRRDRAGAA